MSELLTQTNIENQLDRQHAAQVFEEFASQPGAELSELQKGMGVELYNAAPMAVDEGNGHKALGILEIPKDESDDGYFVLGHSEASGYYLASHKHDVNQLDNAAAGHDTVLNRLPLQIGSKAGDKVILGRDKMTMFNSDGSSDDVEFDQYPFMKGIKDEFGGATSRQHLQFEITKNGVKVIDLSTHGTRIVSQKIQRVKQ